VLPAFWAGVTESVDLLSASIAGTPEAIHIREITPSGLLLRGNTSLALVIKTKTKKK
jgi:hypothetical protein